MKPWEEISKINLKKEEKYVRLFLKLISQIQKNKFPIKTGEIKEKDHYIITEHRMNSIIINIIPFELYTLFKKLQKQAFHQFLGFTILAGKYNDKDVRASCFGVKCAKLIKSIFR